MRKTMILLASTALITVSTLAVPALARDRDRQDRRQVTATQLVNQADAATAQMKADLHITAAQEKDWNSFEAARHDMSKRHADRTVAMLAEDKAVRDAAKISDDRTSDNRTSDSNSAASKPADNAAADSKTTGNATVGKDAPNDGKAAAATPTLIDRINANADAQIARANDWKKLAEAAKPLYASFDDQQKRYFAELLFGADHERGQHRNHDQDRDRYER
ncbi:hypothetical protein BH11PSE4_BH11PSE4_25630 [soil metagenome]